MFIARENAVINLACTETRNYKTLMIANYVTRNA